MEANNTNLEETYKLISQEKRSFEIESLETAILVDKIRNFWKPNKIKTLLLAESHVFTPDEDTNITFTNLFHQFTGLVDYPNQFANFVYCLGYGEKNVLNSKTKSKNAGTWQFWQLFNSIFENKYKVLFNTEPDYQKRILQKILLLTEMRERGIWLLDCSILAVYNNGNKPPKKEMSTILSHSFSNYCKPIIKQEQPENVIVIGKTVFDVIKKVNHEINISQWDWIHQPNAMVSNADRKTLEDVLKRS